MTDTDKRPAFLHLPISLIGAGRHATLNITAIVSVMEPQTDEAKREGCQIQLTTGAKVDVKARYQDVEDQIREAGYPVLEAKRPEA